MFLVVSITVAMLSGILFIAATPASAAVNTYKSISVTSDGLGYAAVATNGLVSAYGTVVKRGSPAGFTGEIVAISVTGDGKGYAVISSTGQVYTFGTVVYHAPNPTGFGGTIVGISVTGDGKGYAAISSAGQVYTYGTVQYHAPNPTGFTGSIVGISVTKDGKGYAAMSTAGQVYTLGTVVYRAPNPTGFTGWMAAISVTADGKGYAAISITGQVYAKGTVQYHANPQGYTGAITSISVTGNGHGYAAISSTGQVYTYGVTYRGNPSPGTPDSLQQNVVAWSNNILQGDAIPGAANLIGWGGGRVPYSYAGGHGTNPGPSLGSCNGYTGSVTCGGGAFGDPLHTVGVDCSGFARWVYRLAAGSDVLPGNTTTELSNPHGVTTSSPVPGDLVLWPNHVGVYTGPNQMIAAPHTGTYVSVESISGVDGSEGPHVFKHYTF